MASLLRALPAVLLALAVAPHARSAAPQLVVESPDVRQFYALPTGAIARLGDLRLRHGSGPAAAFSRDGRSYYTGGGYNEVRVWDLASCRLVRRFGVEPIRGAISRLLTLPDGSLAVFALEGFVVLVDPAKGTTLRTIRAEGKDNRFNSMAVSPDGRLLALGDCAGTIHLREVRTGKAVPFTGTHPARKENKGYSPVSHLTFSPDGKRLLSDGFYDRRRLWDVKTGEEIRTFGPEEFTSGASAFSPDGKLLAFSRPLGNNHVNGPFGTALYQFEPFAQAVKLEEPGYASDVAFRSDGRLLVLAGFTLGAWDVKTGKRKFAHRMPATYGHLALSRDEKYVVYHGRWFDLDSGKERFYETGHVGGIRAVALHEKTAATAADDGTVRGWDAKTSEQLWHRTLDEALPTPTSLAFSPKGDQLAVLAWDNVVRVLDSRTGKELRKTGPISGQGTVVRWSPDGKWIAAGGGNYTLFLFDAESGKLSKKLVGYDGGMNTHWSFDFSPDSKSVVAPACYNGSDFAGEDDKQRNKPRPRKPIGPDDYNPQLGPPNDPADHNAYLALWDLASGKRTRLLGVVEGGVDVLLSQDGKLVAVRRSAHVHVREVASGKELRKFQVTWGPMTSFHGRTLTIGGLAYDVDKGEASCDWRVRPSYAAVSPSGKRMLTAGQDDSTALLWDVEQ